MDRQAGWCASADLERALCALHLRLEAELRGEGLEPAAAPVVVP
jgi:hypothetical protein